MDNSRTTIGIMDIGSNSIRLAIYEVTSQREYRLINENKESARLSEKIKQDGRLELDGILEIVPILSQFNDICSQYKCREIRVAATAAIRNATNSEEIVDMLFQYTGLKVDILSGDQEAYYGFLGVVDGINVQDGFIIDIGGGSTEITLFRNREWISSVSLPIGAVNSQRKYGGDSESWLDENITSLQNEIYDLLSEHSWITTQPGLPLIGLGGSIRALGKLDQRRSKYPLPIAHHYMLERENIEHFAQLLPSLSLAKRKRMEGLSKARADIIVPGVIILHAILQYTEAAVCLVSGTGLREGLLLETLNLELPSASEVIPRQVNSLLAFHSTVQSAHLEHVHRFAEILYDAIMEDYDDESQVRKLIYVSSMLYKIGSGVRYHQYDKHTLYWLTHAPIAGLTHREIVLCAFIAGRLSGNGKGINVGDYRSLLEPSDAELIGKLGSLIEVAIALDTSETQVVEEIKAELSEETILLRLQCRSQAPLEIRGLEAAARSFKKVWKINLVWTMDSSST
ncbi:Ppx/GppA family phosphatase [Paenibacillus anaericanus]|uniref:Ppx/GppA family phosphatase n=1 Tax=Paenibacillus anaericanus TaxID=170367 RepID=A0A433XZJ1_9BACL|nr:Ppx/GppA family phosphatase [Paenibacillus anaericanus]RUT40708.1 Ppx/GppA family phosphatase [Paenibacillus anaericanus]